MANLAKTGESQIRTKPRQMGIVAFVGLPLLLAAIIVSPLPLLVISVRAYPNSQAPPCKKPDPKALRSDQLTVVINGYSEHRIPLLQEIAAAYSAAPHVVGVVILWCNPYTSTRTLSRLSQNVSAFVHRSSSTSLNSRFYPWEIINTRAVLICDDDIVPDTTSVSFAFAVWKSDPDRVVGFFARSHAYDITSRSWIYTMEREKYSIILTKLMILDIKYLEKYSCSEEYATARQIVDKTNNCEDILMNFVVADETQRGPLMVGAKRGGIRDHGDSRNEDVPGGVAEVGLSSRRGEHRKRRGECIREFHRILGRMPLKYSYGKLVDDVGEQGLCVKAGNVVLCDQQQDFRGRREMRFRILRRVTAENIALTTLSWREDVDNLHVKCQTLILIHVKLIIIILSLLLMCIFSIYLL